MQGRMARQCLQAAPYLIETLIQPVQGFVDFALHRCHSSLASCPTVHMLGSAGRLQSSHAGETVALTAISLVRAGLLRDIITRKVQRELFPPAARIPAKRL